MLPRVSISPVELLVRYCNLLKDPPRSFDRVVLARVIHSTVHGAIQQCDVRGKELLSPIEQYFKSIRSVSLSKAFSAVMLWN